MSVTAQGLGTQLAVIGTEHTLLDIAIAGAFTFHIDPFNMAAADITEMRIYQMMLTGGTRRVAYFQRLAGVQPTDGMIQISDGVGNELTDAGALRFTVKQVQGTGRNFDWKVLKYA